LGRGIHSTPGSIVRTQAAVVGVMRACYEETLEYTKNRVQGGKPLIDHPTIAALLSKMRVEIEAARALVYRCAWNFQTKQPGYDVKMGWAVKAYVNEMATG